MGQKRSDLDTIPMCRTHHDYQHSVGWPAFIRKYGLDVPATLEAIRTKIHVTLHKQKVSGQIYRGSCIAMIGESEYNLGPPGRFFDPKHFETVLRDTLREHLIETYFRPLAEKRRAS